MIKIKKIFFVILLIIAPFFNAHSSIKDALYITVGDRAITKSDIIDEIKIILILNNMAYSEDKREELQQMAIKSSVKRNIKEIEINRIGFMEYSKEDLINELTRLADNINVDLDTLKNICTANGIDFSRIEDQIKTELLWNSLIFQLYKNRISVNSDEIDEQLKLNQSKEEFEEFLISEIIVQSVEKDKLESRIKEITKKIEIEGFESVAMNLSLSQSATKGGDLGWVGENIISSKFRDKIKSTPLGGISEPILLSEGILFFKVRDKRKITKKLTLEEQKNQLVNTEKTKILNMYSLSHYDNLRRVIPIKYFDE